MALYAQARRRASRLSSEARDEAARAAKQRLLGNVRLIGQLFNKGMVNDRIVLLIMADLMGAPDNDPAGHAGGGRVSVLF